MRREIILPAASARASSAELVGSQWIAFPMGEGSGFLVVNGVSLSDSRGGCSGCVNVAKLASLGR